MGRISRQVMFMEMSRIASRRSTCHRLNVGSIITADNSPVSIGWNGQEPGAPHCLGNSCPGIVPGKCGTLHAELNALRKAHQLLDDGASVDLYTTHSPCSDCCLLIRNSKLHVEKLFFEVPYRSTQHLGMFADSYPCLDTGFMRHTEVYEVNSAGYIVEYFTRKVVELP